MKYLLPLALLAAAALGATHHSSARQRASMLALASAAPQADPPWLRSDWLEEDELAAADDDPHAGLYAGDDPHAGLYTPDDPHALASAGEEDDTGMCPRADADGEEDALAVDDALDDVASDPHAALGRAASSLANVELKPVTPSTGPNAHTIAEVFEQRSRLTEQVIRVRGTVVKLTEGILGMTILHLWDGSAGPETGRADLTVRSAEAFAIGETVEIEGRLRVDEDLGVGYVYPALLDAATRVATN